MWCDKYNDASRDQHVLLGKILRITRDGAIPPSNPYQGPDSARCNVTGHHDRRQQVPGDLRVGAAQPVPHWPSTRRGRHRFFINDVGEITWEEIDLGTAGADYGWNVREGHCVTGSTTACGAPPAGMTNPIHDYNHDTGCMSITGGAFVPNGVWPVQYDDTYLFGDLTCGRSSRSTSSPGAPSRDRISRRASAATASSTWCSGQAGSGWALYYINWNAPGQEIHRITYTGTPRAHPRPRGATPLRVPLVPAFDACSSPNRGHGAPLAYGSCTPPSQSSGQLTVGTPDANGRQAGATGSVLLKTIVGIAGTTADEADVTVRVNVTDVRRRSDLTDYPGELQLSASRRITDKDNGGANAAGTVADMLYTATVPCQPTADTTIGSACSLATTADAITPGSVKEELRTVWQLGQVQVLDGGADGVAATAPNTVFLRQGVFAP